MRSYFFDWSIPVFYGTAGVRLPQWAAENKSVAEKAESGIARPLVIPEIFRTTPYEYAELIQQQPTSKGRGRYR